MKYAKISLSYRTITNDQQITVFIFICRGGGGINLIKIKHFYIEGGLILLRLDISLSPNKFQMMEKLMKKKKETIGYNILPSIFMNI